MHYKNIDYLDKIDYYKSIGIKSFRLELLDEDYNDVVAKTQYCKNILTSLEKNGRIDLG